MARGLNADTAYRTSALIPGMRGQHPIQLAAMASYSARTMPLGRIPTSR